MKNFFEEFKKFISKGNVLDLAVAVVVGGAFSSIVTSLVDDIIMPLIGIIVGDNFSSLYLNLNGSFIYYGAFIQSVVNFIIIAFCVFVVVKIANKFIKKKEEAPKKKADDIVLLEEIRDLLKKNK